MSAFIKIFDNPLSKYLTFKIIYAPNGCSWLLTKLKKGLELAFGKHFFHDFFTYLILYQVTKFQMPCFFSLQHIKQNMLLSSYLDNYSSSKAMADREKKRWEGKNRKISISRE